MSLRYRENIYLNHYIDSDDDDNYMRPIKEDVEPEDPIYLFTCDKTSGVLNLSMNSIEELFLDIDGIITSITPLSASIGKQLELIAVHAMIDTVFLNVQIPSDSWLYRRDLSSNIYFPLLVDTQFTSDDVVYHYREIPWTCGIQSQEDLCFTSNIIRIAKDEHIQLRKYLPSDNPIFDGFSFDIDSEESYYVKRVYDHHLRRCFTRGLNWELLQDGVNPVYGSDSPGTTSLPIPLDIGKIPFFVRHLTIVPIEDVNLQFIVYCTTSKREFLISMKGGQKYVLNYEWVDFEYIEASVEKDLYLDFYWDTDPGQCEGKTGHRGYCNFSNDIRFRSFTIERLYVLFPTSFPYYGISKLSHAGNTTIITGPSVYPTRYLDNAAPINFKYEFDFGDNLRTLRSLYFMFWDRVMSTHDLNFKVIYKYLPYSNQLDDSLITVEKILTVRNNSIRPDSNLVVVFDSDLDSICTNVKYISIEVSDVYDMTNICCWYNSLENTCDNTTQLPPQCSLECTTHYNEPDVGTDALSFAKLFNVTKLPDLSEAVEIYPNYDRIEV